MAITSGAGPAARAWCRSSERLRLIPAGVLRRSQRLRRRGPARRGPEAPNRVLSERRYERTAMTRVSLCHMQIDPTKA